MQSYDLAERGVCRARWRDGDSGVGPPSLGLRELLLRSHEIADIEISPPPAMAGLLRVLAVLAGRVTGLDSIRNPDEWCVEWHQRLAAGRFEERAVNAYFERLRGRFELFHTATDRPFLQDPRLLSECRDSKGSPITSGPNKLAIGRAAGNEFLWRSHTPDDDAASVPIPEAVSSLLTWLYYGASGQCTPRHADGLSARNVGAGPLRGTVSFHPVGSNLFETLLLGLPRLDGDDPAPWEEEQPPDPMEVRDTGRGLGGVLTGQFRHAVLLTPTRDGQAVADARITWARAHPPALPLDPYLAYHPPTDKRPTPFPQLAQADRGAWRDLDALAGPDERRPDLFKALSDLMDEEEVPLARVRALGFDQDRSQVRDRQYCSSVTPALPEAWQVHSDGRWLRMRDLRESAESAGGLLRWATTMAWKELGRAQRSPAARRGRRDDGVRWLHEAMARYWVEAEDHYFDTVRKADTPTDPPRRGFTRLAVAAYDAAVAVHARTPDELKITELWRARLWKGRRNG